MSEWNMRFFRNIRFIRREWNKRFFRNIRFFRYRRNIG
jgi:hypothetical protein